MLFPRFFLRHWGKFHHNSRPTRVAVGGAIIGAGFTIAYQDTQQDDSGDNNSDRQQQQQRSKVSKSYKHETDSFTPTKPLLSGLLALSSYLPSHNHMTRCSDENDDNRHSQTLQMSKQPRLEDKVAVITGASSGLGQAIAIRFVQEGCKVVLVDCQDDAKETMECIEQIKGINNSSLVAIFVKADISNLTQVQQAVAKATDKFGPKIDVLVNNACKFVFQSVETASVEDWETSMRVNILGHALVTQACLPYMKHCTNTANDNKCGYGPSIIFQGSISSFRAQPNCATYATMKGAIVQLARNCAYDLAKYNIRVNSLCAGTIETPISRQERQAHNWSFEHWQELKTQDVILQRVGDSVEIAKAAVFLASTDSSYVTGTHLMVDGGAAACTVMQR